MRRVVASLAAAVALFTPIAAAADDVTSNHLRELARRADAGDRQALERLRRVDRVDGRAVRLDRALRGAEGAALRGRLHVLAANADGAPATRATDARNAARRILDGRRYRTERVPRPFRGALRQLGSWLRPIGRPFSWLAQQNWGLALLAIAVVVLAVLAANALGRRRTRGESGHATRQRPPISDDPGALEREATLAEASGDLGRAYRLRFRAGLLRLDRAGALEYRTSITSKEVVRQIPSATLVDLARAFDEIAYGGRPATIDDVEGARQGWPRVLQEASK